MIFSRVYFCDTNQKPSIHMLTQAIQFLEIHPKKEKKNEATQIYLKGISSHDFYNIKIGNYLKINNKGIWSNYLLLMIIQCMAF